MLEIAEIISKNIIHIPARPGESKDTLCDFSKIEKATGWQPKIDLREWLTKKG